MPTRRITIGLSGLATIFTGAFIETMKLPLLGIAIALWIGAFIGVYLITQEEAEAEEAAKAEPSVSKPATPPDSPSEKPAPAALKGLLEPEKRDAS